MEITLASDDGMGMFQSIIGGAMGNYTTTADLENETDLEDDFDFDEEEDDFMEKSQRRLIQAKRGRVSRREGDWD